MLDRLSGREESRTKEGQKILFLEDLRKRRYKSEGIPFEDVCTNHRAAMLKLKFFVIALFAAAAYAAAVEPGQFSRSLSFYGNTG